MIQIAIFRAAWVVPIVGPPIADGWVAVAQGRVLALKSGATSYLHDEALARALLDAARLEPRVPGPVHVSEMDLGHVALLPALVNAHTHLELTYLRGRVPPADSMPAWVRSLLRARAETALDAEGLARGVECALEEACAAGTITFGDVSNTLASIEPLGGREIPAVVFHEVLGFVPSMAADRVEKARRAAAAQAIPACVRVRLSPHAPYSTSADLFRLVAQHARAFDPPRSSVHVGESAEEVRFLLHGDGPFRSLVEEVGVLPEDWHAPGERPAFYLDRLGVWQPGTIAVHGVHLTRAELDLLAERDVTLVTCPRSNEWVGAGHPPVEQFAASGVRVAIGTDSLASVRDLNVFGELARLRQLAPTLSARELLRWATLNGAAALGLGDMFGELSPGRSGRFLAVDVSPGTRDAEEALVSGVEPGQVRWADAGRAHRE